MPQSSEPTNAALSSISANPDRGKLIQRLLELWSNMSDVQKAELPKRQIVDLPGGEEKVSVPLPSNFQPSPTVIGGDAGKVMQQILRFAPSLQGRIGKVQFGPNSSIMKYMDATNKNYNSSWKPEDLSKLNLLGATDLSEQLSSIGLNPRINTQDQLINTLGHEVTHAAGFGGEKTPEEVEKILEFLKGIPNPISPNVKLKGMKK